MTELKKSRLIFLYLCILAAFLLIITRLIAVSVTGDKTTIKNFYNSSKLSKRGDILDRNGIIIATDLKTKSLYVNSDLIREPKIVSQKLTEALPRLQYETIFHKIKNNNHSWILLQRNITPLQQKKIQDLKIAGPLFEDELTRVYPQKSIFSHIVGFVDLDRKGLSGIERKYNHLLSDKNNLQLAADVRIQDILHDELVKAVEKYRAQAASGIIMDVTNGEIIALSSLPNFDPNQQELAKNYQQFNRAIQGVYELGSIFKIFTNAIAFEDDLVRIDDIYNVKKPIEMGKFTIKDDHFVKDQLTVGEIFTYSSNIGTVQISEKIGKDRQKKYLKDFGMLDRLNADITALGKPIYPRIWRDINVATISYGHGIAVTPLHIASAVSAMVNGGILYDPSFTKLKEKPQGKRVIKETTSAILRDMLRQVVLEGTGRNANVIGYEVGGKTGTAEKAEYGSYNQHKTIASFVATFPISKPKYLVLVVFDSPNSQFNTGGMVAAPVAGEIIKNIAPILGVKPR